MDHPCTLTLKGKPFMLGAISEPELTDMLDAIKQSDSDHEFYSQVLKLVHHSLRFGNAEISDDEGSISYLASLICKLSPAECRDVCIIPIVKFSRGANSIEVQ